MKIIIKKDNSQNIEISTEANGNVKHYLLSRTTKGIELQDTTPGQQKIIKVYAEYKSIFDVLPDAMKIAKCNMDK